MRTLIFIFTFFYSGAVWAQSPSLSNPNISLNTLFVYRQGSEGDSALSEAKNGFSLQEAELRMTSNIDTHFRGEVTLAVEQEVDPATGESEYIVEPEEAFVETLSLPDFTIRAGKFYAYWARHNQLHTHSFPFIDAPLSNSAILGEEGLNDVGLAASYIVPLPWYFEVVAQGFSSQNENLFGSGTQDDTVGVYYLKSLWDLSEISTLELDLGYGHGRTASNEQNHIYNGSLTFKWRKNQRRSFAWTTEYTLAEKLLDDTGANVGRTSALSSWIQYQMTQRWWAQLRSEVVESIEQQNTENLTKSSALIGYVPSEFSALRLQYDIIDDPAQADKEQRVTLQLNVSMGTHPAHNY